MVISSAITMGMSWEYPPELPPVDGRGVECHPGKQPGPQPLRQRTAQDILLHSVGVGVLQQKAQGMMLSLQPGRPLLSGGGKNSQVQVFHMR
jgi:hypothetical protein